MGLSATAEAGDEEMAERIARHRQRRGSGWQTIECPLNLTDVLNGLPSATGAVLVDCLTLWLSNMIATKADVEAEGRALCTVLQNCTVPVVLVTNEVGQGIMPMNTLARTFRNQAGWFNQKVTAIADEVVLAVSGYLVAVKAP